MVLNRETKGDKVFNFVNMFLIVLGLIIVVYPMYLILISSFSDPNLVAQGKVWIVPRGVTLDAYTTLFKNKDIIKGYLNTIFYTVVGTTFNMLLTLTAAYVLSKKNFPGKKLLMFLVLFTMYFGGGMIATYLVVKSLGLINTRAAIILVSGCSTYNLIVARTFFINGVPGEIEEAATIDGADTFQTFFRIVLPLSKAMIGVIALYYAVAHWNNYFSALIYLPGARDKIPLPLVLREILILNTMKEEGGASGDSELAMYYANLANLLKYALVVVSSLPLLIVYPFLQKYFEKGVMLGSVKG